MPISKSKSDDPPDEPRLSGAGSPRQSLKPHQKRELALNAAAVVGVDAGKFEHALVVRPRGRPDSRPLTVKTTRAGFDEAAAFVMSAAGPGAQPQQVLIGIEFAGIYGFTFAHYLDELGFRVVSVLPANTKRWKEVTHNQPIKTDAKDAVGITGLTAQGYFVSFAFLQTAYAELRFLVSLRERLTSLRNAAIARLKSTLEIVFPEFESILGDFTKKTPLAILRAFPGAAAIKSAPKRRVIAILVKASRGHHGEEIYQRLISAAEITLALPEAQGVLKDEIPMWVKLIEIYESERKMVDGRMLQIMEMVPETEFLLTIPWIAPLTAAVFLGSVGDVQCYESARQVIALAGLSLVEKSSGTHKGDQRISKRGRPVLRRYAYLAALRNVRKDGLFRAEYDAIMVRNGGKALPAVTAVARSMLRLMFAIARARRAFTWEPPK